VLSHRIVSSPLQCPPRNRIRQPVLASGSLSPSQQTGRSTCPSISQACVAPISSRRES
jgi:hypothetical protein